MPSCAMPWMAGWMISRITRAWISGVTTGAGEYAPMPPVLGPSSPSRRRLWSWLVASGSTLVPSLITMKLASSPCRKSSTTTRAPASPRLFCVIICSMAACASSTLAATTTPFPAASPSALITIGAPRLATKVLARSALWNVRWSAVGMLCRTMNALAKSFEDSSCAAARVAPKILMRASRKASTAPAASAASGPTTVRWMPSFLANATNSATSESAMFSRPLSRAVPPLPGATKTFCTFGLWASFQAMACSRPPEPITRSFMSVAEVPHAGEHHGDAALVRGRDHFGVAHAAAGLDYGGGARFGQGIEPVAKREECVRRHHRALEREAGGRGFHGGDAPAVDAAHLSRAHAERHAVAAEYDRVRLHVLGDAPGEHQVGALGLGRRGARDELEVLGVERSRVARLHEHPAADALVVVRLRAVGQRHLQHAEIFFPGKNSLRFSLDARRDHHLGELGAERFGGLRVERAVEGEDPAESRHRIGLERLGVGVGEGLRDRGAAGVGVLDDYAGRVAEALDALPGRVRVGDVVVGQFLPLDLAVGRDPARRGAFLTVKSRGLMRIFTVAQILDLSELKVQHPGIFAPPLHRVERRKIVGDRSVVRRGAREHLCGQLEARRGRHLAAGADLVQHARIVGGIDHHGDRGVILGRRAQHRRSAGVDVLDGVFEAAFRVGHRRLERVEIDREEVDGADSGVPERGDVGGIIAPREQPGVDFRMQRLDSAVEHLRKAGVRRDLDRGDALLTQKLRRAACGHELHAERAQRARKLDDARLVGDAEESPADFRHYPLIRSCCILVRSVLRLMPSIWAARVWFPLACARTISIMGFSTFFSTMS